MSVDKFGRQSSSRSSTVEPGVSARYVNNTFIRRDGSNDVGGDLSMNNHKLVNLSDPVEDGDVINKRYLESTTNDFLRKDGSNDVEGEINMNNHKLVNLSEPTEAQDATTRGYVKNFTRNNFLKLDGTNTMEGDLNINSHKIINLSDPTDDSDVINKRYLESTTSTFFRRDGSDSIGGELNLSNNKIVNVANPTLAQDVATKHYADSRKPVITIWAQETGPLSGGQYEWSFGSGDYTDAQCGYCMPAAGRILRGSLSSVNVANTSALAVVSIVINGLIKSNHITKPSTAFSDTRTYEPPIEVAKNDRINFQTNLDTSNATNSIVSLLIELDL